MPGRIVGLPVPFNVNLKQNEKQQDHYPCKNDGTTRIYRYCLAYARETRNIIQGEEGCETFTLTTKAEMSNTLVLFAFYKSKQAYDWHLDQDYLKALLLSWRENLLANLKLIFLQNLAQKKDHMCSSDLEFIYHKHKNSH